MTSIMILNGPNLNMLGTRQREIYGAETLEDIKAMCEAKAKVLSVTLGFEQSNAEGTLVDLIQSSRGTYDGIILNAGAYTHTSVAIMDAISSAEVPTIELHLSNIHNREDYRQKSYVAKVAFGVICGFGANGYPMALDAMTKHLECMT
ncbi:MAG: type II 3-dehydroquinate dehydratase [Pseudomonadota bacterium]